MSESVFLCPSDELDEGRYREFQIEHEGEPIWLIATRDQGRPLVWFNLCPHQGRPLNFAPNRFLTDDDNRLVCAHHGAVFEATTGECIAGPCKNASLRALGVDEIDAQVFVRPEI